MKDISAKKSFMKKPAKKFTKEPVKNSLRKRLKRKKKNRLRRKRKENRKISRSQKLKKEVEVKKEEPQAKPAVTREKLPINKEAAEKDAKRISGENVCSNGFRSLHQNII